MFPRKKGRLLLAGCALMIATGLLMGVFYGAQAGAGASAQSTQPPPTEELFKLMNIDTAEEASQIVGYRVVTPGFIPEGFKHSGNFAVLMFPSGDYNVMQTWIFSDDPSVRLTFIQDPGLDGIGRGEPAEVAGVPGKRALAPAGLYDRPYALLDLYWRDGAMAYAITGQLMGPIDEEVLGKVALSVKSR